jgi:hypothetical protein
MNLFIVTWLFALSVAVREKAPMLPCPDSTTFFEFQVVGAPGRPAGRPARWIVDTALAVHPTPAVRNPPNMVQFVVDTSGVPVVRTFRPLKVTDAVLVEEARRSLSQWRFTPAIRSGCTVRQLIQTPIGR